MPDGRYPCGAVDLFDFPIDPPHAARVSRGGGDFGVFRQRYDKYHAGEDWGGISNASNLGTPVYSIGHGLVTYAEPLGWGRDQGVVIVQHTFKDNSTILSFYGHLDPDSVTLYPGECVTRGQQVGEIGQPRTVPHLHFEMRTQSPYTPLTGYWATDPTEVGWIWPSQAIWEQRIASAPGVLWTRPFHATNTQFVGNFDDESFILLEDQQLLRMNWSNGRSQSLQFDIEEVNTALSDSQKNQLYIIDGSGLLSAYQIPDSDEFTDTVPISLELLWQIEIDNRGVAQLKPLPEGGLILVSRTKMIALDSTGEQLWQHELTQRPFEWLITPEAIYFSIVGNGQGVWRIQNANPPHIISSVGGHLTQSGEHIWIYSGSGLYWVNPNIEHSETELLFELPGKSLQWGDMTPLPAGGVLLAHPDSTISRLITVSPRGEIQQQAAYPEAAEGKQRLITLGEHIYLVSEQSVQNSTNIVIFKLDLPASKLQRVFSGGTRTPISTDTWLSAFEDSLLLLNIGGGTLFNLNPTIASEVTLQLIE